MRNLILAGGVLISAFASVEARADSNCYLTVSTSEVAPGDSYYYGLYIASPPAQPPGPGTPAPSPRFKVVFWGTKDGVDDIFAPGEVLQGTLPAGNFWLTGYQNPSGPVAGTYTRYAVILFNNEYDTHYCTTNTVTVTLD